MEHEVANEAAEATEITEVANEVAEIVSHWHQAIIMLETLVLAGALAVACWLAIKIFGRPDSFVDDRDRGETILMFLVFASAWAFFATYKDKLSEEVIAGVAFALTNVIAMMGGYYWGKKVSAEKKEETTKA